MIALLAIIWIQTVHGFLLYFHVGWCCFSSRPCQHIRPDWKQAALIHLLPLPNHCQVVYLSCFMSQVCVNFIEYYFSRWKVSLATTPSDIVCKVVTLRSKPIHWRLVSGTHHKISMKSTVGLLKSLRKLQLMDYHLYLPWALHIYFLMPWYTCVLNISTGLINCCLLPCQYLICLYIL